jgi:hypothetical protein
MMVFMIGKASSENILAKDAKDEQLDYHMALSSGYGFASFCFILAFVLLFAASIYLSPTSCGSEHEKQTIKTPLELPMRGGGGGGGGAYADSGNNQQPAYGSGVVNMGNEKEEL